MFADYPATAVMRRWFCSCRGGEMVYTGVSRYSDQTSTGASHQHECPACRSVDWDGHVYPRLMFKDSDGRII